MKRLFISIIFLLSLSGITWAQDAPKDIGNGSSLEKCADPRDTTQTHSGYCVDINEPFVNEYDAESNTLKPVISVRGMNGIEMFSNYIGTLYRYAASIIGIICVLIMVISGIQIIAGGTSSESVTNAKKRMFMALTSLILLFMIGLVLKTINPGFFI